MAILKHYYISHTESWIVTICVSWMFGMASVDLYALLGKAGCVIPDWLQNLIAGVEHPDPQNIAYPGDYVGMPSVMTMLQFLPLHLFSGNSLPIWGGYENGGCILMPGGGIYEQQIPFDAVLSDFVYNGLSVFLQSGLLAGHLSLVSKATAYYRKVSVPSELCPEIDLSPYNPNGRDSGFFTTYSPVDPTPPTISPSSGAPVSQWHDFYPNPVISSYVPFWRFPPHGEGGFYDWHFMAGVHDFTVSTHGLSSGIGYIKLNKPWPEYVPSMEPVGFNASHPSNDWLQKMKMQRDYYSVSAEIVRLSGALSRSPKVTYTKAGTTLIHIREGGGGFVGGGGGGGILPLIPVSLPHGGGGGGGGGPGEDDRKPIVDFVLPHHGGILGGQIQPMNVIWNPSLCKPLSVGVDLLTGGGFYLGGK